VGVFCGRAKKKAVGEDGGRLKSSSAEGEGKRRRGKGKEASERKGERRREFA
jgi:hypothetical protein